MRRLIEHLLERRRKSLGEQSAWVVQLVKCLTLGFGSGHDFRVVRSSLMYGSVLSVESA